MGSEVDDKFYIRSDSFINLANTHPESVTRGKVSASFMYGQARYAAWVSACGFSSAQEMKDAKADTMTYFVEQFEKMLDENLDDYICNFDRYIYLQLRSLHEADLTIAEGN